MSYKTQNMPTALMRCIIVKISLQMQHEMFPIADYHKPWHVVQALYEIPHLQIMQLTDEGRNCFWDDLGSTCELPWRLLRAPEDVPPLSLDNWSSLWGRAQVSELVLIFALLIISPPLLHLLPSPEDVLGLLIQAPETTRGSTEEPVVSEKPQNNSAVTADAAAPTPLQW